MMSGKKVVRELDSYKVRTLCIERGYYTCGDCEQYENMFNMVWDINQNYNDDSVYRVAVDIANHSDLNEFCLGAYDIPDFYNNIWYELLNECVSVRLVDINE